MESTRGRQTSAKVEKNVISLNFEKLKNDLMDAESGSVPKLNIFLAQFALTPNLVKKFR